MGVKKKKLNEIYEIEEEKWLTAQGKENHCHGIRSTVAGYFLHLFCTKNKLMKSFKFTGISICCFISHRLADNPTCGEVQHFVLEHREGLD